jgi:hypothetical protein
MSKHTDGPWHWYQPTGTTVNPDGAAFVCGPTIKSMDRSTGFSLEDARLIASAPTMYAYLEEASKNGCKKAASILEKINGNT